MRHASGIATLPAQQRSTAVRIVLVDDHPAVRGGLESILADEPAIQVVAAAATAADGYERIRRERPDLAILDYSLPGEDGLALCHRLKALPDAPRVLLLTAFADDALAVMAVVAGADGLLSKGAASDLCAWALAVAGGDVALPEISRQSIEPCRSILDGEDLPILGMLLNGDPADDIAEMLNIEPAWLEIRRSRMLKKLTSRQSGRGASPSVAGAESAR